MCVCVYIFALVLGFELQGSPRSASHYRELPYCHSISNHLLLIIQVHSRDIRIG